MHLTAHSARPCPCGRGLKLPVSISGGEWVGTVADPVPLLAVEIRCEEDLERIHFPALRLRDVTCPHCGHIGRAKGVVICQDGCPASVFDLPALAEAGRREEAR